MDFGTSNKFIKSMNFDNIDSIIENFEQTNLSLKKPLNNKQRLIIGKKVYSKVLSKVISDYQISNEEIEQLNVVTNYFNLSASEVKYEKNKISQNVIQSMIKKSYEDKILTDEENVAIINLANFLDFPQTNVNQIKNKIAYSILNIALDEKVSDRFLSPLEETELKNLTRDLQIDDDNLKSLIPEKKLKSLAYAKLLWNLNNGIFSKVFNPPITLKKNEECYLSFDANLVETKIVNKGYTYSGGSVSIKIAKGVRYRTGAVKSKPIRQEVTINNPGKLFLTNLRIVFSGGSKSIQIPFTQLITYEVYSDAIEFVLSGKTVVIKLDRKEVEIFATGLSSSIQVFLSGDGKMQNALIDIENNETFIKLSP